MQHDKTLVFYGRINNYAAMTSVLVEAVKELKTEKDAEIDALKAENDTLKSQNAAILQRLEALEAK